MELDEALKELKRELEALYGDRLKGLYLFGSHARGEAGPDSDVDVAVVLDDYRSPVREIRRMSETVARLSLAVDRHISRVPVRENEWRNKDTVFMRNLRQDAVTIS
ncbi:MAG: nucleotidyltransferase domain-containing protein [Armatimonadota bacterium]